MELNKHVSLNLNVRGIQQSATIAINDRSRELIGKGHSIYKLGLGQSPFPVPIPVVDALKAHAKEKDYLPAKGLPGLRETVAEFHRRKDGVDADPDSVIIGPGSKELMFILQLIYYGELIVPTPCWVSYVPQANIIGRQVRLVPTDYKNRWRLTAELLEKTCASEHDAYRPRIVILNYPGNPDGCTYTEAELKDIAEVARRYEVILLSDEIYGQLNHQGAHLSVARYYPERTIISSGLSKWCGAGGWRLGTFTLPKELDWITETMASVASETYTSVSAPIQYAAVTAFKGGVRIERYLWHARRILATLGNQCYRKLAAGNINVHPPEGGFYLFLDFEPLREKLASRGIRTSFGLCEQMLEDTGVAILPGFAFGRPEEELTARMAYVDFDGARALTASEIVPMDEDLSDEFTAVYCHNVIKAMDLMVDWVNR